MVRRSKLKMALSLLALLGVRTAAAGSVSATSAMTGNVATDFAPAGTGAVTGTNSINGGAIYSYNSARIPRSKFPTTTGRAWTPRPGSTTAGPTPA